MIDRWGQGVIASDLCDMISRLFGCYLQVVAVDGVVNHVVALLVAAVDAELTVRVPALYMVLAPMCGLETQEGEGKGMG